MVIVGAAGGRFVDLDDPTLLRHRLAQLWIAQDEIDNLVLDTESGRAVFVGQFAIKLDRVAERRRINSVSSNNSSHHLSRRKSVQLPTPA